jgi:hypothetical protein
MRTLFWLLQETYLCHQNMIQGLSFNDNLDAKIEIYKNGNEFFGEIV